LPLRAKQSPFRAPRPGRATCAALDQPLVDARESAPPAELAAVPLTESSAAALDARTTHASREACHEHRDAYYACAQAAGLGGAAASAAAAAGAGAAAARAGAGGAGGGAGPGAGAGAAAASAAAGAAALAAAATCAGERAAYDAACPRSWTKYWDSRFKLGRPLLVVPKAVLEPA